MNEHQRKAYEAPVRGGVASPDDAGYYRHDEYPGGIRVTVMVTVDVPEMEPGSALDHGALWHTSVSCWPRPGAARPLPVARWKRRHREAAARTQAANAEGVGDRDAQSRLVEGEHAVHLYVPLNNEELAGLPRFVAKPSR